MSSQSSTHRLQAKRTRLRPRPEALEGRLLLSVVPTQPTTTINAGATIGPVVTNTLGVNLAWWDDKLTTPQTQQMVEAAGLTGFRFPGGSNSDDYHFNVAGNFDDPAAIGIPQFAQFIQGVAGVGLVTLDYGAGSPQEAAAELAYLEGSPSDSTVIGTGLEWNDSTNQWQQVDWQTVSYWASLRAATPLPQDDGYNFLRIDHPATFSEIKYWEVGNEEYGSWEIDNHGTPGPGGLSTGAQHDPTTYAAFARAFAGFAAAIDPGISIGIDSDDPTGGSDNNWTKNVLTQGYAIGFVPGFISDHSYMQASGQESDSTLLLDTVSDPNSLLDWATRYAAYQALLQEVLGGQASSVQVMATEFNSVATNPGKQTTSLVNGLFIADSIGSLLDSSYAGGFVWDLRNGWDTNQIGSPSLYGWRQGGDDGLLGDPNTSDPPSTGPYVPYPSYFAEQLASKIVQAGGEVVSASGNFEDLTTYAVLEANRHLDLLVINKAPDANIDEQFNLLGFVPNGQAHVWQYGEAQDDAQSQTTDGSAAMTNYSTTVALSGSSFNYTFPAYSMTVLDLTPPPALTGVTTASATGGLEGVTPAVLTKATFSDANTGAPSTSFSVSSVNWGDGSTSTIGLSISGNGGSYTVGGSHLYTEEGTYPITIVVADGSSTATITGAATVNEAPTNLTGYTLTDTTAAAVSGTIATFTHGKGSEPASEFGATIDWGDGSTSAGTVSEAGGSYSVASSHSYATPGTYVVQTTVVEDGVSTNATGGAVVGTANQRYLTAVYEEVLGRPPDPAGLEYWANILNQTQTDGNLLATLSSVALHIGKSAEYYGNFVVTPAYEKYLGRAPDQAGLNYWVQRMLNGLTDQELEAGFAGSDEFYANAGGTNIAWIDAVYKLVLGRTTDTGGEQYWNNRLTSLLRTEDAESARLQVALGISGSTEDNAQLITGDYEYYLGRAADPDGLQYWLNQFANGATNEDVIARFTGLPEYYKNKTGVSLS